MVSNYFTGFREFLEDEDKFVNTMKRTMNIPKNIWLDMPVTVTNVKLGNMKITQPTMFVVTDFDDKTVTLKNVLDNRQSAVDEPDSDNEFNADKNSFTTAKEFIISLKDFNSIVSGVDAPAPEGMI